MVCISFAEDSHCFTNLSASGAVNENDVIVMTCSITYSGNWAPVMRWFNSVTRHNFTTNVTIDSQTTNITSQLTFVASAGVHGAQIVCDTSFAEPSSLLNTTATNIPSYTDSWRSAKLNVVLRCKSKSWRALFYAHTTYFSIHL